MMGGGNAQKSKTTREHNLEKNKASKGSQLDTNKKAMNIQDAQNRVYLIKELDWRTGQGRLAISVGDTLKVVACRNTDRDLELIMLKGYWFFLNVYVHLCHAKFLSVRMITIL